MFIDRAIPQKTGEAHAKHLLADNTDFPCPMPAGTGNGIEASGRLLDQGIQRDQPQPDLVRQATGRLFG